MMGEVCRRELCFRQMERSLHFLQERVHHGAVVRTQHTSGSTCKPKDLETDRQRVAPCLELQEPDARDEKGQAAEYQNCQGHSSRKDPAEHEHRHAEGKKGKEKK